MRITVLICTRDRAHSLRKTLESVFIPANLTEPDWELIVVDNNSGDTTPQVGQDFGQRYSTRFRYLVEKAGGKSNALNRGISAASGELIAMIDDDVICAPNYIRAIRKTFSEHPVDGAQGRTYIECEGGRPKYLNRDLAMFMGFRDFGDAVTELKGNLCGTNSVVRASVFKAVGGYRPELGAGAIGYAEDTEMSQRICRAGYHLIYAPAIVVTHQLSRDRITRESFLKRYFGLGCSNAYRVPLGAPLWRFAIYVAKEASIKEPLAFWERLRGHPAEALRTQCEVREVAGFLFQHWRLKRSGRQGLTTSDPLP